MSKAVRTTVFWRSYLFCPEQSTSLRRVPDTRARSSMLLELRCTLNDCAHRQGSFIRLRSRAWRVPCSARLWCQPQLYAAVRVQSTRGDHGPGAVAGSAHHRRVVALSWLLSGRATLYPLHHLPGQEAVSAAAAAGDDSEPHDTSQQGSQRCCRCRTGRRSDPPSRRRCSAAGLAGRRRRRSASGGCALRSSRAEVCASCCRWPEHC